MNSLELSRKELVLIYLILKSDYCPDPRGRTLLTAKMEKILYDFMTIAQIENIEDYYKTL